MRLDDRPGDDEAPSSRPRGRDRATAGLGRIACVAAERPGPASLTWICTAPGCTTARTITDPPAGVWRMALSIRLSRLLERLGSAA